MHRITAYCRLRATNARRRLKYEGWRGVLAACQREITGWSRRTILNLYRRLFDESKTLLKCPRKTCPSSPGPLEKKRIPQPLVENAAEAQRALAALKNDLLHSQELTTLRERIAADLHGRRYRGKRWKVTSKPAAVRRAKKKYADKAELAHIYLDSGDLLLSQAKHDPGNLAAAIETSPLHERGAHDLLYRCLTEAGRKLFVEHGAEATTHFEAVCRTVEHLFGAVTAIQLVSQVELMLGLRRPRLAIYDHAFHFAGGAQRYVAEIAHAVQDRYEVTYITNQEMSLDQCREWYGLDLGRCALKVIKVPPAEQPETGLIDEGRVTFRRLNAFDIIGLESLNYDIFINANMLSKVNPLALCSVFVCHFPHIDKDHFFQVDKYDYLVANSQYTISWTKKRWGLRPTHLLYPPVEMYHPDASPDAKEKLILSVARFEPAGSKKQLELIRAFAELVRRAPAETAGWRLVLAGGSIPDNSYLAAVRDAAEAAGCPIEIHVNKGWEEIRDLYRRAAIFWHACGLDETRPERVEHFGMTTVEAMQNYCVPVVINGGGQREIVEDGVQGFLFSSLTELRDKTLRLIRDDGLRRTMAVNAYERSHRFNRQAFLAQVKQLFDAIETELCGVDCLPPAPQTTSEQALAPDEEHSP